MEPASLVCAACATENRAGRRFCRACGAPLGAACPSCGAANEPDDRFCGACGTDLTSSGAAGRASALGAEQDDRTPGPGPTERRRVSVLFVDLVGFTPFAEDRDPEAVREALTRYFDLARERIERYGGSVEKFIGDAVMAAFGTPVAHEDDAERAVRAALDLVDAVAALPVPDGQVGPLHARAAVMTGEAAVDPTAVGEGMVTGDLVNAASRLQGAAPPGGVLVDQATLSASDAAIAYEAVGAQPLKGRTEPVEAWRALRVVANRRGAGRSARLEAPFVGRDDELRLLKELFHATDRDRRARLVSVTGIGGIGKSRLAWELEKYIDGLVETVYWHAGRSPAYGEGLAFRALAEMIRSRAGIAEGDDPPTVAAKLAETLDRWVPDPEECAWVEPRLAALLGAGEMPAGGTDELFAAWRTLFERIADAGPTILVVEDLHWADDGLLDFIERLVTANRARPIFVLTLARPELLERRPTWGAGIRSFTSLELGPLDHEAMELLLVGLAPGMPPAAIAAIRDRAEGVPLYAVETVRMLVDQGRLTESDGRYRLVGQLGELAVPDSLTALLGARLDGLPDDERALLGHAAVLGQTFTVDALASVAAMPVERTRGILDRLVARDLLVLDEDPRSPERGQHGFVQGLLREVAYGRLSRRERVARHLAAAAHFERLPDEDVAGVVATHLLDARRSADGTEAAALAERAREALIAAADRAGALHAWNRAIGYLEEAAAIASDEAERIEILARLVAMAEESSVDLDRLVATAREVVDWRALHDDAIATAAAERWLGTLSIYRGRPADAIEALTTAWGRVRGNVSPTALDVGAELARARMMAGDAPSAMPIIEEVLPIAERAGAEGVIAELLATKAWALAAAGRLAEAIALLRGNLVAAERHGPHRALHRSTMNLSSFLRSVDPRESFAVARHGFEAARRIGHDESAVSLAANASDAAFELGEWDWIEEIARAYDPEETKALFGGVILLKAAQVLAHRGRIEEARGTLDRGLLVSGGTDDPQMLVAGFVARLGFAFASGEPATDTATPADIREAAVDGLPDFLQAVLEAARIAAWQGRPDEVSDLLEVVAAIPSLATARFDEARFAHAAALIDLVAGADAAEAAGRIDAAAEVVRSLGVRYQLAAALVERAVFAPRIPGAEAAAVEARAILEELGAVTLLARLDAVFPPPSAERASPAPVTDPA